MKEPAARKARPKSRGISSEQHPIAADVPAGKLRTGEPSDSIRGRIAILAYQLYERRGCYDGHDLEDWLEAERLVIAGGFSPEEKRMP